MSKTKYSHAKKHPKFTISDTNITTNTCSQHDKSLIKHRKTIMKYKEYEEITL